MKRGDLVTIVSSGDYGKPRPGLIIQSDLFDTHGSVTVAPLTTTCLDAPMLRIDVPPGVTTGLRLASQVMLDKLTTVPRHKIGGRIGAIDAATQNNIDRGLVVFLGLS